MMSPEMGEFADSGRTPLTRLGTEQAVLAAGRVSGNAYQTIGLAARPSAVRARHDFVRDNRVWLPVWVRLWSLLLAIPVLFWLTQEQVRPYEASFYLTVFRLTGINEVTGAGPSRYIVLPQHGLAFIATLTPACSALAPVLSLFGMGGILMMTLPRWRRGSRLPVAVNRRRAALAVVVAVAMVVIGNLIRVDLSLLFGVVAGRIALILFHNWAGAVFSFAYTFAGFVVMLWLLLRAVTPRGQHLPQRRH
jgi:hypothetical protein